MVDDLADGDGAHVQVVEEPAVRVDEVGGQLGAFGDEGAQHFERVDAVGGALCGGLRRGVPGGRGGLRRRLGGGLGGGLGGPLRALRALGLREVARGLLAGVGEEGELLADLQGPDQPVLEQPVQVDRRARDVRGTGHLQQAAQGLVVGVERDGRDAGGGAGQRAEHPAGADLDEQVDASGGFADRLGEADRAGDLLGEQGGQVGDGSQLLAADGGDDPAGDGADGGVRQPAAEGRGGGGDQRRVEGVRDVEAGAGDLGPFGPALHLLDLVDRSRDHRLLGTVVSGDDDGEALDELLGALGLHAQRGHGAGGAVLGHRLAADPRRLEEGVLVEGARPVQGGEFAEAVADGDGGLQAQRVEYPQARGGAGGDARLGHVGGDHVAGGGQRGPVEDLGGLREAPAQRAAAGAVAGALAGEEEADPGGPGGAAEEAAAVGGGVRRLAGFQQVGQVGQTALGVLGEVTTTAARCARPRSSRCRVAARSETWP